MVCGIDSLRTLIGPLPTFICKFRCFVQVLTVFNTSLVTLTMTATKFTFVCIYKSIPVMDDNLVSRLVYSTIICVGFLITSAKYYLEQFPSKNEVIITIQLLRTLKVLLHILQMQSKNTQNAVKMHSKYGKNAVKTQSKFSQKAARIQSKCSYLFTAWSAYRLKSFQSCSNTKAFNEHFRAFVPGNGLRNISSTNRFL